MQRYVIILNQQNYLHNFLIKCDAKRQELPFLLGHHMGINISGDEWLRIFAISAMLNKNKRNLPNMVGGLDFVLHEAIAG